MEKAIEILRKKGEAKAVKHSTRTAKEGLVDSYIHLGGKIGVLLELGCETDFAAKSKDFKEMSKDLCMHIAASNPLYIKREDVPHELVAKEKEIFKAQVTNKPAAAIEKILEGKIEKFYQDTCLMEQPFVKNPDISIKEYIVSHVAKIGENIVVRRFARYQVGEEI
ncbi:MAG: translation elongation factor Ts, partial [Candidatus Omnitrophota bacterium]|nr:translation elongation factor Ts [Candidatus Omnitrophota bacterium]